MTIRNIRITDPFPTCPLFDMTGSYVNTDFENIVMDVFSTFTELPPWNCDQSYGPTPPFRFNLSSAFGCHLPFGIPNRLVGGTCHHDDGMWCSTLEDTTYNLTNLRFTNVSIKGVELYELMTSAHYNGAFLLSGNLFDIQVHRKFRTCSRNT